MGSAKPDRCGIRLFILVLSLSLGGVRSGTAAAEDGNPAGVGELERLMAAGNEAYERGEYVEAVEAYRGILDQEVESPDLYFNLGNAYLKGGQLGWAVVNYERALRLAPRDGDIRANLEYARARMVDVLPEKKRPWIVSVLIRGHRILSLEQSVWMTCGLWFGLALVAIVALFRQRLRQALGTANLVIAAIFILSLTSLGFKIYDLEAREPGIVVADEVQVMSGPGEDYSREFILHSGTKVQIKRAYQDWLEVSLSDQMRGWVPVDAVEGI